MKCRQRVIQSCVNINLQTPNFVRFSHSGKICSEIREDVEILNQPLTKTLKIAIIGTPNSGKSTFINQIVGRRVFAMSSKVHTTRVRARAVLNLEETQVIFLDTPGLVTTIESNKHKLERSFLRHGEIAMNESNVIGVIHDVSDRHTRGFLDKKVLRLLHLYPRKHSILILNKVDAVKKKRYLLELSTRLTCDNLVPDSELGKKKIDEEISEELVNKEIKGKLGWPNFHQVFMVSALDGTGVTEVMEYLLQFAKPGPWMYPPDVYTDQIPEKLICEAVKSKILEYLPNEVPYNCQVQMELFNKLRDGTIMAVILITCAHVRYEKLAMRKIRRIAVESEAELRNTFMTQVLLKLVLQSRD